MKRHLITFRKFKKNCCHHAPVSDKCLSKHSDNWICTEKLCHVLKSCPLN